MPNLTPISLASLLIVEGMEDVRFWQAWLRAHGRSDVDIRETGGKHSLSSVMKALVNTSGFNHVRWLGIAHDADDDPSAAFARICGALKRASLPVPPRSWEVAGSNPAVVAFVLPDGTRRGDLEGLVWQAVAGDPTARCVDGYLGCLAERGIAPRQRSKARVHAYLASLDRPDWRLGEAVEAGRLSVAGPGLDRVLALLPERAPPPVVAPVAPDVP